MDATRALKTMVLDRWVLILALALPGMLALLIEPVVWLVTTWCDPSWDSHGAVAALGCLALIVFSLRSGPASPDPRAARRVMWLLAGTASVRLAGRLLAVHVVGALALVFDLAALGIALGLDRRPRAVHPAALALLFAFSLPIEQILQRLFGYPLRLVSAAVAHGVLAPFTDDLARQGTLLVQDGLTLAVDLPCSGAQGLTLLGALAAAVLCRRRLCLRRGTTGNDSAQTAAGAPLPSNEMQPRTSRARRGASSRVSPVLLAAGLLGLAVVSGALVANTLRVLALYAGMRLGLDVMAEPWHAGLGLAALATGSLPLLTLARRLPTRTARTAATTSEQTASRAAARAPDTGASALSGEARGTRPGHGRLSGRGRLRALLWALGFSAAGLLIAAAPAHPVDVSGDAAGASLPANLGAWPGTRVAPSAQERAYFQRFGGRVDKRSYALETGAATAVLVRTTAPLRHLHGPDRCLIGAGHRVERLGVRPGAVPAVVWRSTAPDGRVWRVEASFVGAGGRTASSISEVVWHWMGRPGSSWTLLERITPWELCEHEPGVCSRFERTLFRSLDLVPPARPADAPATHSRKEGRS